MYSWRINHLRVLQLPCAGSFKLFILDLTVSINASDYVFRTLELVWIMPFLVIFVISSHKIHIPPWLDQRRPQCCYFRDHWLYVEHRLESASGGKLLRLLWTNIPSISRDLVSHLLSSSPQRKCQTRARKGRNKTLRCHFHKKDDPWTW